MRPCPLPRLALPLPTGLATAALTLALAGSLTACGDDDPAGTGSGSTGSDDTGAAASTSSSPSAEDVDALEEGIDQALASTSLDTIAGSIQSVLDSVSGYAIDGDHLILFADSGSPGSSSICVIAGTVVGSFDVPEGTTVSVEFPEGTEECSI
ncbi:hypothetical protein BH09ACT12_BH09ACT12_14400 [soil metagenome]